jgi:hypothetical protein
LIVVLRTLGWLLVVLVAVAALAGVAWTIRRSRRDARAQ